jgi:hypothetical protein
MLIYFFSITYGMYLASILEFLFFNDHFRIELEKEDFYQFFKGRSAWDFFDYYIEYERSYANLYGTPIKP